VVIFKHKRDLKGKRQTGKWPHRPTSPAASAHVKAAAKDAPFSLWAETNRDEKDPGMKVGQAMTRDAYIAGQQVG